MKYKSAPTPMGNVGVSYENQEAADAQAINTEIELRARLERAEREREELARLLRVLRAYSRTPGNMPDSGRDDPLYPVSGYGVRALWDAVNAALTPKEKP